jgi:hypothetical protein
VITDGVRVSGPRGPDRKWVRMCCKACDETFEQHLDEMVDKERA